MAQNEGTRARNDTSETTSQIQDSHTSVGCLFGANQEEAAQQEEAEEERHACISLKVSQIKMGTGVCRT